MYADLIAPRSFDDCLKMVERARYLGYGMLGILGDFKIESDIVKTYKVALINRIDPKSRQKLRMESKLILAKPSSLEDARKLTFSSLVDGVIATYDSERPRIDYVSLKQLKRNEGALVIPLSYLIRKMCERAQVIRSVYLELKMAMRIGVYPILCSFASEERELVPPRLMISFSEFFFDLRREESKRFVKDFPMYMLSEERKLKLKGRGEFEVQSTD
ncbi:MAG: hypothetical protein LM591_01360 [Candidatus Korarchaeum sp.]|nr:hypothetical protein [Candidatus Korarchaeum sp.]